MVDCQDRCKFPSFKQFGLGLPGCSFFSLDRDLDMVVVAPVLSNAAIISVQSHVVSSRMSSRNGVSRVGTGKFNKFSRRSLRLSFPLRKV